jgi:tartrate-resistant acid phosphatase type 5
MYRDPSAALPTTREARDTLGPWEVRLRYYGLLILAACTTSTPSEDSGSSLDSVENGATDSDANADSAVSPDSDATSDSDVSLDSDTDADTDAIADVDSDTGVATDSDTGPATDSDSTADSDATADSDSTADSDPNVDSDSPVDTGDTGAVHVITIGDNGTGGEGQYAVADAMVAWCALHPCDLVLGLGDNFYPDGVTSSTDPQFSSKFELPYADLDLPFYLVLGNHDYHGDVDAQVAYTDLSSKWKMPGRNYQFSSGIVDFFALDTVDASVEQRDAQRAALEASSASWKVVFGHYPLASVGWHGNAPPERATWLEGILCDQADFYLSGHDHTLQAFADRCGVSLFVSGGGGAPSYGVGTASDLLFAASTLGFVYTVFDSAVADSTFVNADGAILYTHSRSASAPSP